MTTTTGAAGTTTGAANGTRSSSTRTNDFLHAHGSAGAAGGAKGGAAGQSDRHQGDRLIAAIEKIEFTSDRDVFALMQAINRMARELHLILGMRAEELQGVLSQYRGKWYTFGAASRIKARLVAAHLKVAAEAARAIGVAALKAGYAFKRHFVEPEAEAKRRAQGAARAKKFTIGE